MFWRAGWEDRTSDLEHNTKSASNQGGERPARGLDKAHEIICSGLAKATTGRT